MSGGGASVDAEEDRSRGNDGVGCRSHSDNRGRESSRKRLKPILLTEQWKCLGPGISLGVHFWLHSWIYGMYNLDLCVCLSANHS